MFSAETSAPRSERTTGPRSVTSPRLYPPAEPYKRMRLAVSGGHELYVEECGNPEGKPVVVLHGGPGAGCSPFMRRFFDPKRYRIVLFDQRGCGKSTPGGLLEHNTTWDLVEDIEAIRSAFGIERWQVFGGSWGSTLALLYAQKHPSHVSGLILRGVFTMTQAELDWFYRGGASRFYPDAWEAFVAPIPDDERDDLIGAYHRRLTGPDEAQQIAFARPWVRWENSTAILRPPKGTPTINGGYARAFARIESHYFINKGWLTRDDQILADMPKLADIPGVIVQGRYDIICPPHTAHAIAKAWPKGELTMVDDAGHALSEPGVSQALVEATDRFAAAE